MKNSRVFYLLLALALAGCADTAQGPPNYVIPPGPPIQATHAAAAPVDSNLRRGDPMRLPASHTTLPPAGAEEYGRGPAPTYGPPAAAPTGEYVPPNPSPITGYGPGGMMPMPGSPANPPYSTRP